MALVVCEECNKEISDSAKACPHCGKSKMGFSAWFNKTAGNVLTIFIILGVVVIFLFK